ncbi:MAG: bifunctional diguanylate cyclase/phosphohydrolase [Solirubrobacterales bacterium]
MSWRSRFLARSLRIGGGSRSPEDELRRARQRLERERAARREAEHISETVTRRLYEKQAALELLETVATASNEAATVDEAMKVAVDAVCAHTGWPVGHAYLVEGDSAPAALAPTRTWHLDDAGRFEAFRRETEATCFPPGVGLPGRVLEAGTPAWITDVTDDPNFPRAGAAAEGALKAAFAFPVLISGEVVAVLEFFAPEAAEPDEQLLELMAHIGTQLGRVMERERARAQLAHQALHDQLTGLPNRRALIADLEHGLPGASKERQLLILLYDLDGFKAYNDTFGHAAGDALLTRLGQHLTTALEGRGTPYRMGGDEFCVLASLDSNNPESLALEAAAALAEHGEGFSVTASYGSVLVPTEANSSTEALRIADQRMYARKSIGSRASAGRQSTDVLLKVLSERSPDLGIHLDEVTELCQAVAAKLELPDEEVAPLLQAASLHDVGKAAIPDEILNKPGPLDADEWAFMRRHTLIGQRILSAAPALTRAALFVRSSHERFDGQGYPDKLGGEDIPLGARVIGVCDAYGAMRSIRPYRAPMSTEGAVAELRRCAGTQFDPAVVAAFCAVVAERKHPALASSE